LSAAPNQAWAGDITYIRTDEGFLYLALISDLWPRKIAGCHAGDTLEAEGALAALRMAVAELPPCTKPVHHSDRGCQYCCHALVYKRHFSDFTPLFSLSAPFLRFFPLSRSPLNASFFNSPFM
jgi:transposase InsO family protein